ncbi:MAG: protein phosphatase CheZ [Hydrogenovibrio sp.]|nr:protein phosphatase CheZ [Hydrogenovibrio sp.]
MENISVAQIESLLQLMKNQEYSKASDVIDELVEQRNQGVLKQVEEISKNLHETLEGFGSDAAILKHTKHDLPDASERLQYVIEATEEASSKTLSSSENLMALLESIESNESDEKIKDLVAEAQSEVTNIMMAQSFQDLTGQVLNRVIMLVTNLEQSLHDLIEKSGIKLDEVVGLEMSEKDKKSEEMKGVGPNVTQSSQKDSVASQADVDDLLGDLGI